MPNAVGPMLRHWRQVRHLSQLDLSATSGVSQRHLSFVETGKARPSRQLVLHLARVLEVPLRDRNALLQAAGFAAVYPQSGWDDDQVRPAREAIEFLLRRHEPYPAVVLDRHWNLVAANPAAGRMIATFAGPDGVEVARGNAMRLIVHPDGLRRSIVNWTEVGGHMADRIRREAASYPDDDDLQALAEELLATIGDVPHSPPDATLPMTVETQMRHEGREVSTISMLATVGGALDVTVSELVVELFFPADPASAATLQAMADT
jgi:transcriptional regulator with XRE-family HTH domain